MLQPSDSAPLTVTFDTNTLASVVAPETAQGDSGASGKIVAQSIQAGRIHGFFSETLVTLEGIAKGDRAEVLGRTQVVADASSTGRYNIEIAVGIRHFRKPLHPKHFEMVRLALELGMRPLRTAARIGGYHLVDQPAELYEPDGGIPELIRCMDRVNELTTEIARRGVGQAIAVQIGLELTERDGADKPELWLQGLGRARTKLERKRVAKAVAEWADGDSVAAHYGFGMKLFCSDDFGRSSRARSVLDCDAREWLRENFGIEFIKLNELAQRFEQLT